MNIVDIINKKRLSEELTKEEIEFFINGYVNGEISDYQISPLLMAICLNGMSDRETSDLTEVMLKSGDTIDLSTIEGVKVDKHSTGGVGDKTTMIVLPLVAACGVVATKMSGRGLGFTGGTIDKLESIPGFRTNLTNEEFVEQVKKINAAVVSQTGNLVPADKKIYALRDVTGTVESIPLIASSIMSKKLASGADKIVIDLKVGNGALMKNINDAKKLAELMTEIGRRHGKETVCLITDMNQPLGHAIGNALEVKESIEVLQNNGSKNLRSLSIVLSTIIVSMGLNISYDEANRKVLENLKNGNGLKKFKEMVECQGGNLELVKVSDKVVSIKSTKTGFVRSIDTSGLGELARKLGGGRYSKEDEIDHSVGIVLNVEQGDFILEDEELLKVYYNKKDVVIDEFIKCFEIEINSGGTLPLVYELIR